MKKKYNVGVVGYGWAATAHIEAINATTQGQVAAVCSTRKLDAAELAARHDGTIRVYNDLASMLADPLRPGGARQRIQRLTPLRFTTWLQVMAVC